MTAPPRPEWLWARKGELPEAALIVEKAEVLELRAYIEHLERENAKLKDSERLYKEARFFYEQYEAQKAQNAKLNAELEKCHECFDDIRALDPELWAYLEEREDLMDE